jgi:hypothetical protein
LIGIRGGANLMAYARGNPLTRIDQMGLSDIVFSGSDRRAYIYNGHGELLGSFPAANNAQRSSRGPWAEGTYDYLYHTTHADDAPNSAFGSNGNFVFDVTGCIGCGFHSGRVNSKDLAGRSGPDKCRRSFEHHQGNIKER